MEYSVCSSNFNEKLLKLNLWKNIKYSHKIEERYNIVLCIKASCIYVAASLFYILLPCVFFSRVTL